MAKQNYNHELIKDRSFGKIYKIFNESNIIFKEVLLEFNHKQSPEYYQVIFQNLLQRIYLGLLAIEHLLKLYKQISYIKYPIAIQMRACILDSITIAYLSNFIDPQKPDKFSNQILRLNQPAAKELNDEIENEIKNHGIKSSDCHESYRSIISFFQGNYTKGPIPKLRKDIKPIKIYEMLQFLKTTQLEYFTAAYEPYKHYSKYQHFGSFTKTLLDLDSDYEFDKIIYSSGFILQATYIAILHLEINPDNVKKIENLRDNISDIEKTFNT